jgi:hypothetical protein
VKRNDAAALAAIAAAYAVLAARSAPAAPPPSRWRLAGRPAAGDVAFARNVSGGSRWAKAGRAGG